jgi:hypothetical protein
MEAHVKAVFGDEVGDGGAGAGGSGRDAVEKGQMVASSHYEHQRLKMLEEGQQKLQLTFGMHSQQLSSMLPL